MGGHTGKETDPAFAAPIGGLISSLHLLFSLFFTDYMVFRLVVPMRNVYFDTSHFHNIAPYFSIAISPAQTKKSVK